MQSEYAGSATLDRLQKQAREQKLQAAKESETSHRQAVTPQRQAKAHPAPNAYLPKKAPLPQVRINQAPRPKSVFDVADNHVPGPNRYDASLPRLQRATKFPNADRFRLAEVEGRPAETASTPSCMCSRPCRINGSERRRPVKVTYLASKVAPNTYHIKWKGWK
ncbi:hypothetical protein SS50377_25855 [Spironucleus salmonicida]|uniref:Uncharacterized protein n=1 Tax=Spironucleus salmonicida TaxID=348837 RepID=V6LX88_9EUKA|nr:hypothetical protein SS50377_25838 [Spironucleus salmonicida]KAH0571665.1 hypothetical protein SS50377_25855 [Spironucleus salmonicida]|eukprot:EST45439.1 Hypothetical protein SS50377_14632 [Spironucleus salmonicida]